jgi:hypothetical protein
MTEDRGTTAKITLASSVEWAVRFTHLGPIRHRPPNSVFGVAAQETTDEAQRRQNAVSSRSSMRFTVS